MFLTIELHNFPQVFANQIMHLFYMLYAYVSIARIVYVWPYMCWCVCVLFFYYSILAVVFGCANVISKTWAHFVAFCINQPVFVCVSVDYFVCQFFFRSSFSIQHVVNWRY